MVYELVAGGVLSSVFIPVFIEHMQRDGESDAWKVASYVFNLAVVILGIVALAGTIWAEPFVRTQTFRISAEEARVATYFFRFFAVQIVFYGAIAIITGILNSYRRFLAPAIAPVFNNLVVIATLLGFYVPFRHSDPDLAVTGLAIGTTLGVVTMALVQVPSLVRVGIRYTARIDLRHPALRKMGRKMVPILAYVATNMVALSFRNAYAFEVSPKGPAALQYAWMFYQLPYGIFAVSLATALFPELSSAAARKDWPAFKRGFNKGLRATAVLIVPLAAMLIALSEPVITLYRAGDFSAQDVPLVAGVLEWWAAGLFSFAAYMFVLRTFYSIQDTRTPMLTNLGASLLRIALYAGLTVGVGTFAGYGLEGIPIADAIVFTGHFLLLALVLRKRVGSMDARRSASSLGRIVVASIVGGVAARLLLLPLAGLRDVALGFLVQLLVAGSIGLAISYGLANLLGVPEMSDARAFARRALARLRPRPGGDEV
jgi:putative peptidoglycan lipid II flippase